MTTKESPKSTRLEMTPKTIAGLRKRSQEGLSLKDFLIEAEHIAGKSLITSWIASGHNTFEALLLKMEEEQESRASAVPQAYFEELVAKRVVPEQDDIPF